MAEKVSVGAWEKTMTFFHQVRTEMSKVSWPTKEECKNYATVVIVATIIVGTLIAVWDYALSKALAEILKIGVS
ncbi:MAG: SecE/Sec61-gamma subunit of protein translocation complex [Candidatus Sumerlaeota bacterium]|nr:SecE/Sec61-gamma subunit of protein translocation complex [Candidatus Sumerlaeota bacterium]